MDARTAETLTYPFATPPAPGEVIEVAPGILWIRMPLPFRLNHVNLYLIDDGDGWAVLDAGIGNDANARRSGKRSRAGRWPGGA